MAISRFLAIRAGESTGQPTTGVPAKAMSHSLESTAATSGNSYRRPHKDRQGPHNLVWGGRAR